MAEVSLVLLRPDDREQFIRDNLRFEKVMKQGNTGSFEHPYDRIQESSYV